MLDDLLDIFDRDRKRPTGERRRGLGGLLDRLTGDDRDDDRPVRPYADDRYDTRADRRRSDDGIDARGDRRYDAQPDRRRFDDDDDDRDEYRGRKRREFELWDD